MIYRVGDYYRRAPEALALTILILFAWSTFGTLMYSMAGDDLSAVKAGILVQVLTAMTLWPRIWGSRDTVRFLKSDPTLSLHAADSKSRLRWGEVRGMDAVLQIRLGMILDWSALFFFVFGLGVQMLAAD